MNFTQLQARAQLLASLEGWTDVSPAPAWDQLVNQAWMQFSWDGECILSTVTFSTVIGQTKYQLSGNWKRLTDVIYDTTGTVKGLYHTSEDYERFVRSDWQVQPSGISIRYAFSPFSTISLVPSPSAVVTVSVRGVVEGTPLVNGTDVPPTVDVLHEAIALKAAIFQGKVYAQGNALQRLTQFETDYQKYVQDAIKYANFESMGN